MLAFATLATTRARADGVADKVDAFGHALEAKLRGKRTVYAYTDDRGRLTYAAKLEDVPQRLQQYAREVDAPEGFYDDGPSPTEAAKELFDFSADDKRAALATIYRINTPDGRVVYTNLVEQIPPEQRASAAVDLSHVSLNTELGNALDKRIQEEHARLTDSKYCQDLIAEVELPVAERMWRDERPLVICFGVLLLLLLITPWMVRKVGGPEWGRTLMMAIPALVISGVVMFGMMKANSLLSSVQSKAQPCEKNTWDKLAQDPKTGLGNHLKLVQQLQQQISQLEKLGHEGR